LGRYAIDAEGLPVLPDDKDAKAARADRAKRLLELNAAKPVMPPTLTPIEYVSLFGLQGDGCGMSFQPIGKEAVIASIHKGFVTWRPEDKNATLSGLPLQTPGHAMFAS